MLFDVFTGRTKDLKAITRFSLYKTVFYRTNLDIHTRRVSWIVEAINPIASKIFGQSYDPKRAQTLALVHDDPEIIMGDIQAGNKSKMTKEQLDEVKRLENDAIQRISERFPQTVSGFVYKDLLNEAHEKKTLEAQVVQYADKFDALGESCHEVFGGNVSMATNVVNEYGKIPLPVDFYVDYFEKYFTKYPEMMPLRESQAAIFRPITSIDIQKIVRSTKPHTLDSIKMNTGYEPYELWKTLTIKYGSENDLRDLVTQKEFFVD